ncbi:MAG: alpha/beta hydrolase [Anaerolineae bacterium]|nr:alpha/beta hydrolase [Anaerolineae bacterium]
MKTRSIYKSTAGREEIMALYNQVLAQWPLPYTQLHIPTRYGSTFVMVSGVASAPPLVLLHGSASNSATWRGDVVEYGRHFQVYAVDIPGEPGKSDPQRFSWDGPAFNEWLDDVLNGLNLEKVILGGISLGGWAVIKYALYKPERVEQAILIVPSGIQPPRLSFVIRLLVLSFLGKWGRRRLKQFMFKGSDFPEELERFLTLVGRHFNYRMGSPPLFTDAELQSLTMPVLYLAGEKDALLDTPKTAERLQKLAPDLTVKIFKEDGHATVNTAALVVSFLKHKTLMEGEKSG